MDILEKYEHGDRILKIYKDLGPWNPNDAAGDNEARIFSWLRHGVIDQDGGSEFGEPENFKEWAKDNKAYYMPVFAYIHSGMTISCQPYGCPWDSGFAGYVYITLDDLKAWGHNWKRITATRRQFINKVLIAKVKEWDSFLTDDVYGYTLEESAEEYETEIGSCWGIYGFEEKDRIVKHFKETGKVFL